MKLNEVDIFLIADEKYAPCMCVTIASILENVSRSCAIHILDGGINPETQRKITEFARHYHYLSSIEFIGIDIKRFEGFPDLMHFSLNTYFRYLIPELRPAVRKAIYIDSDMVITSDIAELYVVDMQGKPLAAVPYRDEKADLYTIAHPTGKSEGKATLGLPEAHLYFNAGLLVIDCEYFRQHGWVDKLFELTAQKAGIIQYPDQDILNILTCCNYHVLDDTWNAVIDIDRMYGVGHATLPHVLHFTGGTKTRPWLSLTCPYREQFDYYADKTPFAQQIYTQRLEHELLSQKAIIKQLVKEEYTRKRGLLNRVWMRICGRRTQNQQAYQALAKMLNLLNIE